MFPSLQINGSFWCSSSNTFQLKASLSWELSVSQIQTAKYLQKQVFNREGGRWEQPISSWGSGKHPAAQVLLASDTGEKKITREPLMPWLLFPVLSLSDTGEIDGRMVEGGESCRDFVFLSVCLIYVYCNGPTEGGSRTDGCLFFGKVNASLAPPCCVSESRVFQNAVFRKKWALSFCMTLRNSF